MNSQFMFMYVDVFDDKVHIFPLLAFLRVLLLEFNNTSTCRQQVGPTEHCGISGRSWCT